MATILIADAIDEEAVALLGDAGHTIVGARDITQDELLAHLPLAEGLIVRSRTKVTAAMIDKASSLKIIARAGTGVDTIDVARAKEKEVVVVNAPGANSQTVAEHTIALLFALSRAIVPTVVALKAGRWEKKAYQATELSGKTLGIIGFGAIGQRVATFAHALGMTILVHARTESSDKQTALQSIGGRFCALEELASEADIVSLHVPLTGETEQLISAKRLARMKPTAYLINTSRGGVIDERALIDALKTGKLAGAGLDVFATEPLSSDSALLTLPNVVVTPHVASVSPEAQKRASLMVAEDIHRFFLGEELAYRV